MRDHAMRTGQNIPVDVYGSGPDLDSVEKEAQKQKLALKFNGAKDHADPSIHDYKVRLYVCESERACV
jgi:digalactosyldiacylglycerol synthase